MDQHETATRASVGVESQHLDRAAAEQSRRDRSGDEMSPGEYIGSMAVQATHELQAEIAEVRRP